MSRLNAYQVKIPITDAQKPFILLLLYRFNTQSIHVWSIPKLEGNFLAIHPADFTNLISFAEHGDCSELEFYRLRKLGASAIESALAERKSALSRELKNMTLDALRGLAPRKEHSDESESLSLLSL